jgi:hypothetical protein
MLCQRRITTSDVREFVRCANPEDGDYPPKNRHCNGRIYIDGQHPESSGVLWCPDCDRPIFPDTYSKRRQTELRTSIDPEGISSFLVASLDEAGIASKPVAEGVFRLEVGAEGVTLCVVEFCTDQGYLSRERGQQNPTCYIGVGFRDFEEQFLAEDWVVRIALLDLICGQIDLAEVVQNVAEAGRPRSVTNASIPVWEGGPNSTLVPSAPQPSSGRKFAVEVGDGVVFIEGVKVIAEQAGPRFVVFRTLWQWFLDDLRQGLVPKEFKPRPLVKIISELECQLKKRYPDEASVRRVINNLQATIEQTIRQELGLPIDREDIVQTCPNRGQTDSQFGYRINPFTVMARPFLSDMS